MDMILPENSVTKMPIVKVSNMSLSIPTYTNKASGSVSSVNGLMKSLFFNRRERQLHQILKGVNLELHAGDRLGVLGVNGAGKSTLLRTIAGIYAPTSGSVEVKGKIGSLFDVNLGFHPEATGVENVFLRGLLMGLNISEIKGKLEDVREFTELGSDLNKPYRTYSQGMRLRLAIAVSTLIEPDVLIMDEWIGSADKAFKYKVHERLNSMIGKSKVLILASHNDSIIKALCNKFLVLEPNLARF